MTPSDVIACDSIVGLIPAHSCANRHLKMRVSLRGGPKYPECAACLLGWAVVVELKRGGWEPPARVDLSNREVRVARQAKRRWMREHTVLEEGT